MSRWVLVTPGQCPPDNTPLVSSVDELAADKARIDEWKAKASASFPGRDAVVEPDGHVGHGAILHGCIVGRNALIGMNAVIMDGVELGAESIVGAQAFLRGETVIPPRSMVVGSPAKVIREVSEKEVAWKTRGTAEYQQLARDCLAGLMPVEPLKTVEADRPGMVASDVVSIQEARRTSS